MDTCLKFCHRSAITARGLLLKLAVAEPEKARLRAIFIDCKILSCYKYSSIFFWRFAKELEELSSVAFLLLTISGRPVKLLSNVSEIFFQIRHLFEMQCQVDKSQHVRYLFFAFWSKLPKLLNTFVLRTEMKCFITTKRSTLSCTKEAIQLEKTWPAIKCDY